RVEAQSAAEGNPRIFGPGRRKTVLLLRQQRPAQADAERRDFGVRAVLEGTHRQAAGGTDLRLQADNLCESASTQPARGAVHHPAAAQPAVVARLAGPAAQRLAADR